jgi:hypothetical protein
MLKWGLTRHVYFARFPPVLHTTYKTFSVITLFMLIKNYSHTTSTEVGTSTSHTRLLRRSTVNGYGQNKKVLFLFISTDVILLHWGGCLDFVLVMAVLIYPYHKSVNIVGIQNRSCFLYDMVVFD